jgi:hypothetical protein
LNPVDAFWHFANFFAPAVVTGFIAAGATKLLWRRELAGVGWGRLGGWASAAMAAVLVARPGDLRARRQDGHLRGDGRRLRPGALVGRLSQSRLRLRRSTAAQARTGSPRSEWPAHLGDPDVDQAAGEVFGRGEIDHPVALGPAHLLGGVVARAALDQDALDAAEARGADRVALGLDPGLQALQAFELFRRAVSSASCAAGVPGAGCRRS